MQENQVRLEDSMELLDIAMILTEEVNAGVESRQSRVHQPRHRLVSHPELVERQPLPTKQERTGQARHPLPGQRQRFTSLAYGSPATEPPLEIESAQQQLLNLVQSEGDTTP